AFGSTVPPLAGLSAGEALEAYARFTLKAAADAAKGNEDGQALQERLFAGAQSYGALWRRRFRVTTREEAMRAARVLYRAIGIEFRGSAEGAIEISRCFFSCYYTPEVCRLISALDAGVLAGLSGGGRLVFTRRITEGANCCQGRMEWSA
ncbi:MAG TPA: hypothetical protein PLN61_11245, partial [bacterium]|nr:hypothetical protein [bacterium]